MIIPLICGINAIFSLNQRVLPCYLAVRFFLSLLLWGSEPLIMCIWIDCMWSTDACLCAVKNAKMHINLCTCFKVCCYFRPGGATIQCGVTFKCWPFQLIWISNIYPTHSKAHANAFNFVKAQVAKKLFNHSLVHTRKRFSNSLDCFGGSTVMKVTVESLKRLNYCWAFD